jgi:hypothetical protein
MNPPLLNKSNTTAFLKEWMPVAGGGAGLIALYGFATSFLLLPSRVDKVEEVNKSQEAAIIEIRSDAQQRRELLAQATAMIAEINDRTKRMQDIMMGRP